MGRYPRNYTLLAIGALLFCGTFYRYQRAPSSYMDSGELSSDGEELYVDVEVTHQQQPPPPTSSLYPSPAPKLTIIAIWNPGHTSPLYLPNFFASVAANPQLDVLFIKDDRHEVGCDARMAPDVPNVREVCLTSNEYWGLHADFLCRYWESGCSESERESVFRKMVDRRWGDRVHAYFRPFRHAVFAKWLNPATPLWGECDMDVFLGNFARAFPWDEAITSDNKPKYDMLLPSNIYEHPDDVLLYIPGHLAFYANSERLTRENLRMPQVASLAAFLSEPWMDSGAPDEGEWSHWAFTQTNLTFLRFPGLVAGRYHLSSAQGTFSIDNAGYWEWAAHTLEPQNSVMRAALTWALREHANTRQGGKTLFSSEGQERPVMLRVGKYEGPIWYPWKYAVDFHVPPELVTDGWWQMKKFLIRREPGAPIVYRTEPTYAQDWFVIPPESFTADEWSGHGPMMAFDCLYNHFQTEKFAGWWSLPGLPSTPLGTDEVLFVDKDRGTAIWDAHGRLVWEAFAQV